MDERLKEALAWAEMHRRLAQRHGTDSDAVVLADEIIRLQADIESLKSYCGVYASGWRSPFARSAVSAEGNV